MGPRRDFVEKSLTVTIARTIFPKLVPKSISRNFRAVGDTELESLMPMLTRYTLNHYGKDITHTEEFEECIRNHLWLRLNNSRIKVVPWLNAARPLRASRILEIGCGTGSSSVALAEQGARVTALDIDGTALEFAKQRASLYGLEVDFHEANAIEVDELFRGEHYDWIIFYATLEHMTFSERIVAMRKTWEMLSPGDNWCVIETPNRLWFYDGHTSQLPFYHWLPDDLAQDYCKFSPRTAFRELSTDLERDLGPELARWGRGLSYHEFDLSMKPAELLNVVSCLDDFWGIYNIAAKWKKLIWDRGLIDRRYESLLRHIRPDIHKGFFKSWLNLIIRKN